MRRKVQTVATGVAGEPTAPGSRSGGAVSRKRLRLLRAQPVGELAQVPDLAEIDAELEQAMRVQRQRGAMVGMLVARPRRHALDRVIVGDQRDDARCR